MEDRMVGLGEEVERAGWPDIICLQVSPCSRYVRIHVQAVWK